MQMRHKKEEAQCTKAYSASGVANEMARCLWRVIDWDEMQGKNRHSWELR